MRLAAAMPLIFTATLAASGVGADPGPVLDSHVLPGTASFAAEAQALAVSARHDCSVEAMKQPFNAAFDAWLGISHLRFGPLETDGRALAIAFWPDSRNLVTSTLNRLIADSDPVVEDSKGFARVSVAGRGLFALERLLFEPGEAPTEYACALREAIATDLARMATEIDMEWQTETAPAMRDAGAQDNTVFRSPREADQALYTALLSGLEFDADQRLGRPLGTFDAPRPARAEARRSGRSLKNVILSLEALRDLARALAGTEIPETEAAFDRALAQARGIDDPVFAGVDTPAGRFPIEVLQQEINGIRAAIDTEIGEALGIEAGFNSADGD